MEILDAVILGIVQGLTEFLPVSSSGHLELGKAILGSNAMPKESLLFTVILHFATALSTIVIFRKDIVEIFSGLFKAISTRMWTEEAKFSVKIIVSMIPAVIIGYKYERVFEELFGNNILLVGSMLIVTAILLFLADRAKRTHKKVGLKDALIIGVAQGVAMLPGISRSGATISTSVLLGIDKIKAARFSFLMVIPLIFGKIAKDILAGEIDYTSTNFTYLSVGFIAAFISGLFACTWMIKLVKQSKLTYFAIYCIIVGVIAIIWSLFYK
ncbi:undecaprenyl-diphosphate phosphatase [Winogradskyella luteola]|uniref:Undecaprenyl-diphosphatase n=1 Tax=Winogradskyella luteola TaxID=2828330 RepID=A0A9X1JPN8_9FLAO|nr:undecaprenyl-diphosphate phosphatase [Winogradskyella luteola]MBV7268899.1 undecaprenyl-diphosphate phosphatase [Winogradskyella luteola]